jgi:arylsulfatase A-like enzyme
MPSTQEPERPRSSAGGWGTSLRAGLNAGLAIGAIQGLADGAVALARTDVEGWRVRLGCLGGSVLSYSAVWVPALLILATLSHAWLRGRGLGQRFRWLAVLGLAAALFFEIYWWTRPYVYWGRPAHDPRRLAAAVGQALLALVVAWVLARALRAVPRGARLVLVAGVPLIWLTGFLFLPAARGTAQDRGRINERNRDLPNVLLFVVDALRADVLSCYGHPRVETPAMDRLAARGVLFEQAWTQAPFTWTSFGSLLTGKYPRRHGLVRMEPGWRMLPNITLPWHLKSARRLAGAGGAGQALRDEDWAGAAFLTGTLSHGSGLIRGFDQYYEAMVGHGLVVADSPWSVFRSELLLDLVREKLRQRFDQHPAASVARRWLAENARERRFVAMAHYYSTHTPYDPPQEFRRRHCDPDYAGPIHSFYADARIAIETGRYAPTPADVAQIQNLYYAGVEHADQMIGEVVDELERAGVLDDTLIIVTSDHGEELGDHGLWEHNHMYETNLRVPLIVSWPRGLPQGVRVGALVELVDVVPSVCALLGLEPPYEPGRMDEQGRDRGAIDGLDFGPLARGQVAAIREHAFSENGLSLAVRDRRFKLVVPAAAVSQSGWADWNAGRLGPEQGLVMLFDLQEDPQERRECSAAHPEVVERLLAVLREWDARMPVPRAAIRRSGRDLEAERRNFERLGYTDKGVGARFEPPAGANEPSGAGKTP